MATNFSLNKSIDILSRTPHVLNALFSSSEYDWSTVNEGEGTWSAYNILGHFIHGENTDWIPRALIILKGEGDKTFEPYDRFAQDSLYNHQSMDQLLKEFEKLRSQNIKTLKSWNLNESDLNKKGVHPDLGPVTLRQLIANWTVHDLAHINQFTRVMVKHYRDDIGPWKNYFRLLK